MNRSVSTTCLLFLMVFFSQFCLSMEQQLVLANTEPKTVTDFSDLLSNFHDRNKQRAINAPIIYKNGCYGFNHCLNNDIEDETRLLLGSVYFKQYEAVETVLNSSDRRSHCYYFNGNGYGVLGAYIIARKNKDEKMLNLLKKYNYNEFYSLQEMPTDLMICCYARNVDCIKKIIDTCPPSLHNKNSIEDCLTLSVNRRDVECINLLLSCPSIRDTIDYYYYRSLLCKILIRDKMEKVLETLLASGCYRLYHHSFELKREYAPIIEKYIVKK